MKKAIKKDEKLVVDKEFLMSMARTISTLRKEVDELKLANAPKPEEQLKPVSVAPIPTFHPHWQYSANFTHQDKELAQQQIDKLKQFLLENDFQSLDLIFKK